MGDQSVTVVTVYWRLCPLEIAARFRTPLASVETTLPGTERHQQTSWWWQLVLYCAVLWSRIVLADYLCGNVGAGDAGADLCALRLGLAFRGRPRHVHVILNHLLRFHTANGSQNRCYICFFRYSISIWYLVLFLLSLINLWSMLLMTLSYLEGKLRRLIFLMLVQLYFSLSIK